MNRCIHQTRDGHAPLREDFVIISGKNVEKKLFSISILNVNVYIRKPFKQRENHICLHTNGFQKIWRKIQKPFEKWCKNFNRTLVSIGRLGQIVYSRSYSNDRGQLECYWFLIYLWNTISLEIVDYTQFESLQRLPKVIGLYALCETFSIIAEHNIIIRDWRQRRLGIVRNLFQLFFIELIGPLIVLQIAGFYFSCFFLFTYRAIITLIP